MILFVFGAQVCIPGDALAAAKRLGYQATVFARKIPCGISLRQGADFCEVDLGNEQEVLRAARAVHDRCKLKAVLAYDDEAVPIAARHPSTF